MVGLCWRSLVDFHCWFLLKINIFSGPLQSSYFPGLIDGNGELQGLVETLPSNPFTLCEINWGLLTRSWLNLVQNIFYPCLWTCPHGPNTGNSPQQNCLTKWHHKAYIIILYKLFYAVISMSGKQQYLKWCLEGVALLSKSRLWCEESLFENSHNISIHWLIIHPNLQEMWQVFVIYITRPNHMLNFVKLPEAFHSTSSYCMCSSHLRVVNMLHGWMLTLDGDLVLNCILWSHHWFVWCFRKP